MWMHTILTFLLGVVTGGCLVGTGLWYVLSFFFHDPDKKRLQPGASGQPLPQQPSSATFQLPPVLLSKISDESCKAKESCWAVNFILYFLFRELKNSEAVRRWVLRKLALEFDELLATSVLGKFFANITIQNIDLGQNFPVVNWLRTAKVELHPVFKSISTLDILVDLDYAGGFQFSIQAESHLKHSAFLSVQFNAVKGQARLQFASEPYAHWSFTFTENPEIDIAVVSQLYGKSFNQVTAIIAAQLKRSVKKKHTLPMYKIRYKPFFNRIQPLVAACVPNAAPRIETTGSLTITIIECRGLMQSLLRRNIFASLGIAKFDWVAAYECAAKEFFVVRDVGYIKTAKREAKLDFRLMQQGDNLPVVESVETPISIPRAIRNVMNMVSFSPTECVLQPGDEIIAVDGKRVSTIKNVVKYFRNSSAVRVLFRIRRRCSSAEEEIYVNSSDGLEEENVSEGLPSRDNAVASGSSLHTNGSHSQNSSRRNSFSGDTIENFSVRPVKTSTDKIEKIFNTTLLPACRDPIFQESATFTLEEAHQFINIGCWSSDHPNSSEGSTTSSPSGSPVKRSKFTRPGTPPLAFGRDSLVATLSIPLADVVSECSTTGMGFFVKDFYFGPPDGSAAVEARENELKNHSGFEPSMCYGKVTLSFQFKAVDDQRRKGSVESAALASGIHLDIGAVDSLFSEPNLLSPSDEPQAHRFVRTHFKSSAVCDYCNKKIWLKEAYVCELCSMRCHKKCNERCLANTICRGEMYQQRRQGNPEIITTESEPHEINRNGETSGTDGDNVSQANGASSVRRRTLGGLIASAVQGRSTQLKRAGSATTLLPPSVSPNNSSGSKSLPPSPETSPATSRKTSVAAQAQGSSVSDTINPFLFLDPTGSGELSTETFNLTLDRLMQYQGEDLVSLAKDSGKELYANQSLAERKEKLNNMLYRLQEEIDALTFEQKTWTKDEAAQQKNTRSEDKVQAVAILMLHYCAGLQSVQDLEEINKEPAAVARSPSPLPSSPSQTFKPDIPEVATDLTDLTADLHTHSPHTFQISS